MTYQQKGAFSCDECPDSIETEKDDFKEAWAAARRQGWRSFKGPDGEWAHVCPGCVEQFAEKRR